MTSRKLEHLNERLRHMLGTILERESNDPRFRHVTITGVHLAKDLSHARVSYTTYDALVPGAGKAASAPVRQPKSAPGMKPKAFARSRVEGEAPLSRAGEIASLTKALNQAAGFFSHAVARTLETRVTPRLTFVYDPSIDYSQQMENALKPLRAAGQMGDPNRPEGGSAPLSGEHEAPAKPSRKEPETPSAGKEAS